MSPVKNPTGYAWLAVMAVLLMSPLTHARLPVGTNTIAPMLERVTPAVVNISTTTNIRIQDNPLLQDPFFRHFFGVPNQPRQRKSQSLGSGVIVDARNGYVLTNHHVVHRADEVSVTLDDGREYKAEVIGSDPETDVAVIKIPVENLTAIAMGDSDRARVGDFVVAIGNPFGLNQTVTSGIVSALGRSGLGIEGYEDFIQTDASINPGNSGGALVNMDGQLIGINTAIVGPSGGNVGIGFAIPVNMARSLMQQILRHGKVERGQLGVHIQDLTPDLARAMNLGTLRGALISQVLEGSSAQRGGVRSGDVVTAFNGRPITSAADLRNAVGLIRPGQRVQLELIREGSPMTVNVQITPPEEISADSDTQLTERLGGGSFAEIEADHPLHGRLAGILVKRVAPGSPAYRYGLEAGDIITSVNPQPVSSLEDFRRLANAAGERMLLHIRRGNQAFYLIIK